VSNKRRIATRLLVSHDGYTPSTIRKMLDNCARASLRLYCETSDPGQAQYPGSLRQRRGGYDKAELVDHVAAAAQFPKHQTDTVITQFLQAIMDALQAGETVELRGFGRFRLRHAHRVLDGTTHGGHAPDSGKAVPAFTAGKAFQESCAVQTASH